jgi:hypothetical protein
MNAYRIVTRIQDQDDFTGVPQSGQVVYFDASSGKFTPADLLPLIPSVGRTLSGLTDVQVVAPSGNDVLMYRSGDQKWTNEHILDGGNW